MEIIVYFKFSTYFNNQRTIYLIDPLFIWFMCLYSIFFFFFANFVYG